MSHAAKPFSATIESVTPTQDGNRLVCVKLGAKRWSLSVRPAFEARVGRSVLLREDGPGRAVLA